LVDIENGLWETYRDQGLLVYGANRESEPILRDFIDQTGITFPVLLDEPAGYYLLGGLSPYPRDFIIDADGIVQYADTEYRPTEMSAIIERLLPTAVEDDGVAADAPPATRPVLAQNLPNPFNPSTTIRFDLPADGPAELTIFDIGGRRVRTLVADNLPAGSHARRWDGRDERGAELPSGIYLYRLRSGGIEALRRMVLLR